MLLSRCFQNRTTIPRFNLIFLICIFGIFGIAELAYFTANGQGGDFPIFYEASKMTLNLSNPWDSVSDPVYSAYLNGPITSLLISPLGLMSQDLALELVRFLSIVMVPYLTFEISRLFFPNFKLNLLDRKFWLISTLVLLSFPIRANLEYGQMFLLFAALAASSLRFARSNSRVQLFLSGLLIGFCCDYKPQCFLIFSLLICFSRFLAFIGGLTSILLGGFISSMLTSRLPYEAWIEVLRKRMGGGAKTGDQMHLYSLSSNRLLTTLLIGVLFSGIVVLAFPNWNRDNLGWRPSFLLVIFTVTFFAPWMHSTDLVFFSVCAMILHVASPLNWLSYVSIGAFLVWSNNLAISAIVVFVAWFLILISQRFTSFSQFCSYSFVAIPSIIFPLSVHFGPSLEESQRKWWGLLALYLVTLFSARFRIVSIAKSTSK